MQKCLYRWNKTILWIGVVGIWLLSMLLSGCALNDTITSEVTSPEVKQELPAGEAIVNRPSDVEYSVPEGVSVLMYHMVGDETDNAAVISVENFTWQMQYLKDHGYHPITMQELNDYVTKGSALPSKPVCITFDDGYADNYSIVYPLMKKFGFPWTLFLITGEVGHTNRMTWEELKEMANSHAVTIADHTVTHPRLSTLSSASEQEKEIRGAKQVLKEQLGINTAWISYPYGDYNEDTQRVSKEAGIALAVTMNDGRVRVGSNPYELSRVWIGNPVTPEQFAERLTEDNYTKI